MIRTLERLSMNAWPAIRQELQGGWVVRFAEGYTRRANSAHPLEDGGGDLRERIATCEAAYREAGLPVIFKMTEDSRPGELDGVLEGLGYRSEARTSVQTLEIPELAEDGDVIEESRAVGEWLEPFARLSGLPESRWGILERMLSKLTARGLFVRIEEGGDGVACGMGVIEDGFIGLFDIVTREDARGRGLGRRIVSYLLQRGRTLGAKMAYLQVMLGNDAAWRLYQKLGFREVYQYWYRIRA